MGILGYGEGGDNTPYPRVLGGGGGGIINHSGVWGGEVKCKSLLQKSNSINLPGIGPCQCLRKYKKILHQ